MKRVTFGIIAKFRHRCPPWAIGLLFSPLLWLVASVAHGPLFSILTGRVPLYVLTGRLFSEPFNIIHAGSALDQPTIGKHLLWFSVLSAISAPMILLIRWLGNRSSSAGYWMFALAVSAISALLMSLVILPFCMLVQYVYWMGFTPKRFFGLAFCLTTLVLFPAFLQWALRRPVSPRDDSKRCLYPLIRAERTILKLAIGTGCPLLAFVAGWWMAAAYHLCVSAVPTPGIITAAFAGLGLGCVLDVVFLQRWVEGFYAANPRLMAAVYLGLSAVAFGLSMGIPTGTFALGTVAGFYVGRRGHYFHADAAQVSAALCRIALLAAFVTAGTSLPIGLLALRSEKGMLRLLEAVFGLAPDCLEGSGGLLLIATLCLILFGAQYAATRLAGHLAFRIGAAGPPSNLKTIG